MSHRAPLSSIPFLVAGTIISAVGGAAWEPCDPHGALAYVSDDTYKTTFCNLPAGFYEFKVVT